VVAPLNANVGQQFSASLFLSTALLDPIPIIFRFQ
jgi:hypothetical protein